MNTIGQQLETLLDLLDSHRYYAYNKPFDVRKIDGIEPTAAQSFHIEQGLATSASLREHLEQALSLWQKEQQILQTLFPPQPTKP